MPTYEEIMADPDKFLKFRERPFITEEIKGLELQTTQHSTTTIPTSKTLPLSDKKFRNHSIHGDQKPHYKKYWRARKTFDLTPRRFKIK